MLLDILLTSNTNSSVLNIEKLKLFKRKKMNAERKKKFFNQIAKKANEISQSQKEFVKVKEKLFDL